MSTYRRRALSERNKTSTMLMTCPAFILPTVFSLHLVFLVFEGTIVTMITGDIKLFARIYLGVPRSIWERRNFFIKLRKQVKKG